MERKSITVETTIHAPAQKVWDCWTMPEHITKWCQASDDWHAPAAENDVREGGRFKTTMAAKDGSAGFDFAGTYTAVVPLERIEYVMDDERKVSILFQNVEGGVQVTETFELENENPEEMQRQGWQAILENFKKYVEASA